MPQIYQGNSAGGNFGNALGTGLNALIANKLGQYAQQQQQARMQAGLAPLFGENSQAYSNLPQELLQPLIKQTLAQQERVKTSAPGLQQLIPELTPEDAEKISSLTPGIQLEFYRNYLAAPKQTLQQAAQNVGIGQQSGALQQLTEQASPQKVQQPVALQPQAQPKQSSLINVEPKEIQKAINQPVSSQELIKPKSVAELVKEGRSLREAKIEAKEARKEAIAAQKEIDKETKKFYDSTLAHDEAADTASLRLNKMENLIKKGSLPISTFYNVFKNLEEKINPTHSTAAGAGIGAYLGGPVGAAIGGGIGALINPVATVLRSAQKFTSPNAEEFEKLSTDFIREAKAIFGQRVTDQDLQTFLQLIPTLSQTDNGKLAIIKNMRMFNKASQIKADSMRRIIKENDGKRPANLQILVNERSKPELDKLAKEFALV